MKKQTFDLFRLLVESKLGEPLEAQAPRHLSGWDAVEALWPLNEVFRPGLARIRSTAYDSTLEVEADAAIKRAVTGSWPPAWGDLSAGAWRVLLERHVQGIAIAIANERVGNHVMSVPAKLTGNDVTLAVMVFLLHAMKLPWPPEDRSTYELPSGDVRAPLRLH